MQHDPAPARTAGILDAFAHLNSTGPHRLDARGLVLAVGFAMVDVRSAEETSQLASIQAALWREDPEEVAAIYHRLLFAGWAEGGTCEDGERPMRRPRRHRRHGLTVREMAERAEAPREAMARALEHHGFLHMAPFGGRQSRRMVTELAEEAGYGHNADGAAARSVRLDGHARVCTFPVFYPERVSELLAVLDFPGIRQLAGAISTKRDRLGWLLTHHGYLPSEFLAGLAGCSESGVKKARARLAAKVTPQVRYTGDGTEDDQSPAESSREMDDTSNITADSEAGKVMGDVS